MNRFLRSQYPPNPRDLAVFDTTTGSSQGRTRGENAASSWRKMTAVLIAFFMVGVVFSQTVTVVVPTGGTALGNTNGTGADPVCRYYNSIRYQVHYTAAELTAAGVAANAVISKIAWNVTESSVSLANYTVKMANTTQANGNAHNAVATTQVKNPFTYAVATGFNDIVLDVPFTWDGTSNLLVEICTGTTNPFTTPYGGVQARTGYATTAYGARSYRVDGVSACATNTSLGLTNKPVIRLTWTGATPCAGTPAPGNTLATANPVCAGTNFTLSLQNATSGTGVTYQWYSSLDGVSYAPVSGATSASLTTNITAASYFYCAVTCSGNTGNSTPVNVTLNSFLNCYCSSIAAFAADEEITNVAIGTLSNASTCATLAPGPGSIAQRYANYKSGAGIPAAPDFIRGASTDGTVTIGSCGTINYTSGLAIFIDLNQDGDYLDAGEKVYSNGAASDINCVPATVKAVSLAIPATATLGLTTMRIINAEGSSGNAITGCFAYGYGETEDYMVNIVSPPPPPTITSLGAVGGCAGQGSVVITGTDFAGVTSVSFAGATPPGNLVLNLSPTATNGGWIDEVSWTLTNNLGVVIGSGGAYTNAPVSVAIGNAANGPYSLFIETQGNFNDNEVIYDVTCNGTSILSGIQTPNTTQTYSVAACDGTPGAGVNATYTVNSTTQITANIPATANTGVITVTTAAGSASSVSFDIYAIPTTTVTGGATICSAGGSPSNVSSATLTASGSGSVAWTPSTGLSAATGASVTASPSATTTYTATLTDANGCVASGTTTVSVNQTPSAPTVTPANPTVCAGSTVDLTASSTSGSTSITASSTSSLAINDNVTTTNTIAVSGVGGVVNGITVTLNGTHTWVSDVTFTLTAPNGASITLMANEGGSGDNFTNVVFSSSATASIVGAAAPFTGTWLPETGLFSSLFSTPNGTWTLSANDNASGDTGTITAWSINITAAETLTYTWFDSFASPVGSTATITTPALYYNEYYSVQVATPNCTSNLTLVPIIVEEVSGIVLTPVNVSCNGLNNGSFTQTQTCGTAPFSYVIVPTGGVNTGAYTPGIPTNLAPGTYDVYLQDANLFTNSVPVALTITEPAALPVVLEPTGASICAGVNEGNISALSGILIPGSTTVSSGAISVSVPDANATGTTTALTVTGVPAGAITTGVSVTWNMTHTWDSDMQIRLIGPDGTNVDLCLNNGGSGDNFVNTTVSSAATNVIGSAGNNTAPFTGTFGAEEDMSQLFGNGNGAWTLSLIDQFGGDLGLLTDWSITISYLEPSGAVLWYDAATGGTLLGAGNTLDLVGTSICPEPAVAGTYTAYAFSTDGTCLSAGTPVTLTVGTPMAVAIDGMPGSNANCTYSIGLSDSFGDGWNGNTATVLVNGTAVLSGITLASGAGPQYYNFSVSAGQTISVVYTPAGGLSWPEENSYVVFDGANGAGAAVYTAAAQAGGPTTPASVTNNCGSSTVCPGTEFTLTANVTGGGQPYTYAWSTGETTPSITVAASSTPVGLTVTDACGTIVSATDAVFSLYTIPTPAISGYNGIPVNDAVNAFQTGAVLPLTSGAYNGGQWNVTGIDPGTTFQWTYATAAAGPYITIAGATANPQTLIANGAPGTVYLQATVTTAQGCATSTPAFQVVLSNIYDTPCTAGSITIGDQNGFVYSNAAAGVDAGEPAAPAGGCNTQTTWCNATLNNTVWFSFVAPASGHVSINGAGFDSQFALYSATNCADYSTFTLIAANDDANANFAAGLTDLQCLTPGATYYLQVDGYGAPGTFTITVADLGNTAPAIYNTPANQTVNAGTVPPMAGSVTAALGASSVAGGGSQTLSGIIPALPAGATITSTQVVVNGVTTGGGTWVADMTVAVSGAVTLPATTLGGDFTVTNAGPYAQTTSNPTLAGGAVDVTLVDTYTFGTFTATSVNVVVNYTTPASNTNTCDAVVLWTAPFISDDQPNGLVVTQSHNSGDTFPVGTTTVTYTATDCAGLVATSSFTVTVVDVTAPTATADADVTVDAAVGACSATVALNNPTATDNCGVATITNDAPATFPIGTTVVTWTVTDVNSNVTTVTQNVTVNVNAGSVEVCDNADNDCDSQIDEGLTFVDYYADADGDSYGAGTAVSACSQPAGYVTNSTDCDDSNNAIYPGATEVCNGADDNCDGTVDENCHTFSVDMTCAGVTFTNVYVTGPWCGWCGAQAYNLMTDPDADGIYTVTVSLAPGNVEYKYMVDNWASQENLVDDMVNGGTCAPVTDYFNYANRLVVVGSTNSDVYGRCTACDAVVPGCTDATATNYNSAATVDNGSCLYATTFNVDMSCAGSFTNVYVTGPWCGWCDAQAYNLMTDANGDGIYTVTVNLGANIEYKYMVDNWASQENLVDDMQNGGTCAPVTDYFSYANRTTTGGSTTNDVYGRCSACPILGCTNVAACNYDATATQDDGSCVLPALSYYVDADNDGFGAGNATLYCTNPGAGYSTLGTDCNDALAAVNPNASENCSTTYDDNCNGSINEGCVSNLPGENPSNAISMATSTWPNCFSNVNSTLAGMSASAAAQTTCLTGEDKWYQFVATTEGVSILVNSTQNDILIELQTAAGTLVAQENAVAGLGNEILNFYGLTAGQVYKVGIRNYNSALGIGTFSACVRMLKRGGCDYGPGPYSLCQYFKATWAGASGTSYRFTFTGTSGAANGNVYTKTQSTDICVLSTVTPTLPYGSSYNVLITNIYTLQDGAGNNEVLEVPALAPCTLNTIAEPVSQLRASDNCASGPRFRSAVVASLPWSCGAVNWRWEFIEVDGSNNPIGLPIYHLRNAASNYLNLGTVAALQYGKTYAVRTCPIFTYTGTNYNWGPVQYMCIIGQSGMITEGANAQAGDDVKDAQDLSQNLNVYPNPTNGSDINIQLSNITSENVQVRVLDAMGRVVFANRYSVDGMFTTNMTFDRPLANGLYMIEASFNGEVLTQRMMVQK